MRTSHRSRRVIPAVALAAIITGCTPQWAARVATNSLTKDRPAATTTIPVRPATVVASPETALLQCLLDGGTAFDAQAVALRQFQETGVWTPPVADVGCTPAR